MRLILPLFTRLILLLLLPIIFSQPFPTLTFGPTPNMPNKVPPFSGYAVLDIPGNYTAHYTKYVNNTKILEDEHFDEKKLVSKTPQCTTYDLIFSHSIVGELFRLREQHYAMKGNGQSLGIAHVLSPQTTTNVWIVKKFLRQETKSSWVGDHFKYLDSYIMFIELDPQHTRLYYQIAISADERNLLFEVIEEAKKGVRNIYALK